MRNIPIRNIYFLLCYAWDMLDEKESISVEIDDNTSLVDLLAKVLLNGSKLLLKRGLNKAYVDTQENILGIKGKLLIGETIKSNLLQQQRTICNFDEYSHDILINRIIYSTILNLIHTDELDSQIKHYLSSLIYKLPGITPIRLSDSCFKNIPMTRNTRFYSLLMQVCKLIYKQLLPSENRGEYTFKNFDEERMNTLFEAFLRNFYRREQDVYHVSRTDIRWKFFCSNPEHIKFIPKMQTDITLESDERKIIIDAKYYQNTMTTNYQQEKLSTGNLYQLFSYLINQEDSSEKTRATTGILLYPKVSDDYHLRYVYEHHSIIIHTIDLGMEPSEIKRFLIELVL